VTPERRVNRILLDAAREVYAPAEREPHGIAVDTRCSGCGLEHDGCDRPLCPKQMSWAEE